MRLTLLSTISLGLALLIADVAIATRPVHRQEDKNIEVEFCQRSPLNKRCVNFIPEDIETFCINYPLDKRCEETERLLHQQDSFYCSIQPDSQQSNYCKILVEDDKIVIYLKSIGSLSNDEERTEIAISKEDIFSFHSQWWLADVGDRENSVGMFTEIQIGYLLNNTQDKSKSSFLTISAEKILPTNLYQVRGFSNENMPKIVEKLEPWLYYKPDIAILIPLFRAKFNNTNTQVSQNVQRLLNTKECPWCNLTGANLVRANLTGANLVGANLEGANLTGANLEGTDLRRAYLIGANLNNASLYEARLGSSILMFSSLNNSNLSGANLQVANLKFANLNNANLTQARLDADGLNVTQLQNASLINANLTEANLSCANLDSVNLKKANLTKANVGKCMLKIKIRKGDISSYLLNKAKVSTPLSDLVDGLSVVSSALSILSSMSGGSNDLNSISNLENLGLRSLEFIGHTNLKNANLSEANLTEANLNSANLFNSNLSNSILNSADVEDTDFSNANLIEAQTNNLELEKSFLCNTLMSDFSIGENECINSE